MPKITDLTSETTPAANDVLAIVDVASGTTKKITRGDLISGSPLPVDSVTTAAIEDGAVTEDKLAASVFEFIYPVGIVVTLGVSTNPATLFGIGTWTAVEGRVIVGKAASGTFSTLNATMGSESNTHTHTYSGTTGGSNTTSPAMQLGATNIPVDVHTHNYSGTTSGASNTNNIQPTIVKYVWQRTA